MTWLLLVTMPCDHELEIAPSLSKSATYRVAEVAISKPELREVVTPFLFTSADAIWRKV